MKFSIIIPVYNSKNSLRKLNKEIDDFFEKKSFLYEKIYINDFSSDGSLEVLIDIYNNDKLKTKIINLSKNYGQQSAIFAGMHYASGDFIITIDDDLQHDISFIDKMIDKIFDNNDLVYGIYNNRYKNTRTWGSKLTGLFFKMNYKNLNNNRVSSYRIFSKKLLEETIKCKYNYIYISAIMLKYANSVSNVYIEQRKREYGKSGYNIIKLMKIFLKLNYYYSKLVPEFLKLKNKKSFLVKGVYS